MLRRSMFLGFALPFLLSVARLAAADFVEPSYSDPIGEGVCGNLDTVAQMQLPDYFAAQSGPKSTVRSCQALCRAAVGQCKQATSATGSCYSKGIARSLKFELSSCAANNTVALSIKQCKETVRDDLAASKAMLKIGVTQSLANCAAWGTSCMASCGAG
ncbi:MAG TPA: hypothetical protein VMR86_00050 [Myxococcota bacterium]|nr:hypothetical protein [Myxococcota bacterium]